MISLLNLSFALIDLCLLVYLLKMPLPKQAIIQLPRVFICALLCGMTYDNLVVASGYWFIQESWFATINIPRFYLHVLVLPFLSLFTYAIIRQSGIALGKSPLFFAFCLLVTISALAYGISHELLNLQLVEKSALGTTRMSNANSSAPMATIVTNIVTLILAGYLWRKSGWKILFLGALFIFVVNGASATQAWGFLAGNFAEIIFVLSLITTLKHFSTSSTGATQEATK